METESPLIKKAREINAELEQIFAKPDRKCMSLAADVVGIIIIRFKPNDDIAFTAVGRINFALAMRACMESEMIEQEKQQPELNPVA